MTINATREQRRQLERDNAKLPVELRLVPRSEWPAWRTGGTPPIQVWRSRDYLVQEFLAEVPAMVRLSVCRTTLAGDRWRDGISWDELQRIKNECGYENADAVEVFPAEIDKVNVANMRHLWVMCERLPFAWRRATT
jgi:hypothetical protein